MRRVRGAAFASGRIGRRRFPALPAGLPSAVLVALVDKRELAAHPSSLIVTVLRFARASSRHVRRCYFAGERIPAAQPHLCPRPRRTRYELRVRMRSTALQSQEIVTVWTWSLLPPIVEVTTTELPCARSVKFASVTTMSWPCWELPPVMS